MSAVTPTSGTARLKALVAENPAIPLGAEQNLTELAADIRSYHATAIDHFGAGFEYAIKAGEKLLHAKKMVAHGAWLPWLKANCQISEAEAQRYMRCAKHRTEIEGQIPHGMRELSLTAALKAIAKPREESTSAPATPPSPSATRTEKKLRAASEAFHDLEPPERREFLKRVEVEAKLTPPAISSAEYRLVKAEEKIAELEAQLDAGTLVEPGHAAGEHEERAAGGAELQQVTAAEDDPIASRKRQLADLDAAWDRADSAVRQNFHRRINAECPMPDRQ